MGDGRKTACDRVEGIAVTQLLVTKALFEQPSYRGHIGGAPRHEDGVHGLDCHIGAFEGDVDRGANPLSLPGGETRKWLEDGDTLTITGWAQGEGYRVGFGEVTGHIVAAK